MYVLVINAGSSSVKYQLFDMDDKSVLAKGLCERIGIDGKLIHKVPGKPDFILEEPMPAHSQAIKALVNALIHEERGVIKSMSEIHAIGHRVVHGGPYFTKSVLVTPEVIKEVENCRELAPLHNGAALMGIEGCLEFMPETPQVLVFDTAFHQSMPKHAYFYPVPQEYYDKYKIRKYGFHGTSHFYVSQLANDALAKLGKNPEETKIITCHLGNGSSISAVKGGKCMDTSMGFTPLDGIIMGSRTGAMDPAIVLYILEKKGFTPHEMNEFMNKKCGILGVSGVSSDLRDVIDAKEEGDENAALALEILIYGIKKYIGSYAAAMGGLDAVVFTAGIGENNPELRKFSLSGLEFMGIKTDDGKNNNAKQSKESVVDISDENSAVKVFVVPTNEELVIASDTEKIAGEINR
ncbi:MAG: acetate kinase [Oscillospiraceae bacterium]|nr:acetate kinase [Oscillospiraceae bacterium]